MGLTSNVVLRGLQSNFYLNIDSFSIYRPKDGSELYGCISSYSVFGNKDARDSGEKPIFTDSIKFFLNLDELNACSQSYGSILSAIYSKIKELVVGFDNAENA